jgi:hypothetical protein
MDVTFKKTPGSIDMQLDDEARSLSDDDLSILLEDIKREIEFTLLQLYHSVQ